MSVLFGPRRFVPRRWSFNSQDDCVNKIEALKKSWEDQKTFLQQFSSQELFQIHKSALFLSFTAEWAVIAEGRGLGGTRDTCQFGATFIYRVA